MGFFGFGNFNKPGPGVNKEEPPKAAPIRYFEIFGRKFTKLLQANLLFFVPFLVVLFVMIFLYLLVDPHPRLLLPSANPEVPATIDWWLLAVVPLPCILLSPFTAGLTMITRNFAREEHSFIWTDFMKATKNNLKYFLLNGVLCYFVYVILTFAVSYYYNMLYQGWLYYIPLGFTLVVFILFTFAQYYLPILFITFDLKFKQAYRNAFIFAALGMGRNILLTLLFIALVAIALLVPVAYPIVLAVLFLLAVCILFAFISFTISFVTYPLIKKYMIDKPQAADQKQEEQIADTSLADYTDFSEDDAEDDEEYVYINGRLMKKSDIKNPEDR